MSMRNPSGPSTKATRVLDAIRDDVMSGRLGPGSTLDEIKLAEQHHVSRTPVREAFRTLHSEGLLVAGRRRQMVVVEVFEHQRQEILLLRFALEGAATAEACRQVQPDDLDRLRLALLKQHRHADSGDIDGFLRLDEQFHVDLAGVAGLPTLSRLLAQLGAFVRLLRLGIPTTTGHMEGLVAEHERLIDLLEARDPDALHEALRTHISNTAPRR